MLDLAWTWIYYLALFLLPIMLYCLARTRTKSRYSNRDWFYVIKYFYAKRAVKKYQDKCSRTAKEITREDLEKVKKIRSDKYRDNHYIYGLDQNGNSLSLKITIRANLVAEVYLVLRLADGATYTLPDEAKLCSISKWQWKAGGVRIDVLEPLKRLRITHNGMLLRSITATNNEAAHETTSKARRLQHVQFNFIFNATGLPTYYPQDASSSSLADSIASETWRDGHWLNLLGDERGYEQFGALYGSVRGEAFAEDLILNLPACRTRFWGTNETVSLNRAVRFFVVASDGTGINVWIKSLKKGCQSINYGNVLFNTGNMAAINDCDFRLRFVAQHGSIPAIFAVNIKANNKHFSCVFHIKDSLTTASSEAKGYKVIESQAECDFDSIQGRATVEFWYSQDGPGCELPAPLISSGLLDKPIDVESKAYLIGFKEKDAKFASLTGGKGSSLAMLTSIQTQQFKVPDGFVVTTKCFREHCEKNFNLRKGLSILEDMCFGKTHGDIKEACEEVAKLFRTEKMNETLAEQIIKTTSATKKYAVRSSGVSEDTEELSAAGQNETILGATQDQILESVSKCWASLFSYQSVTYRHQHGLPIKSQMAVVIQEMIPSQVAGVLFTCHPSSGNPSDILITANYGLGESVVSGKSEPDSIVYNRYAKTLTKTLGSKETSIRMCENGTEEVTNDGGDICLSDSQCVALAEAGVAIEAAFGDARDIEWAFSQGQLYLLQSRPITTLQSWSDSELLHEFDTPTFTDDVVFTVANTGEVFPGSQSTLTVSAVCQSIDMALQTMVLGRVDPSAMKNLSIFQNHVFIDVVNGMHRNPQEKIPMSVKIFDLSIFGHPVINERINNIGIQRFGIKTQFDMQKEMLKVIKNAWNNKKNVAEIIKAARDLDDGISPNDTTAEMYRKIDRLLFTIVDVIKYHVLVTSVSVFYQILEMNILVGSSEEITPEHCSDIALILSSNDDVISAEIPTTLEQIAKALHQKRTEFLTIDPKDGVAWLKANCPEASDILVKFLQVHGHRVLGEFDVYKKPWDLDPSQIIKMIQINCSAPPTSSTANKVTPEKPDIDAIIAKLKSPKNNFTRRILKFLLKKSRKAVGAREQSKCEAVRSVHKIRLAYRKLAARMTEEGLIPTADLIFHLSHYEIKEIVVGKSKRAPQLIQKAWRRHRLYPAWNKLKFPEISYGLPQAEDDEMYRASCGSDVRLEGTPVCNGTVEARACVITGLDEIDQLRNGDILITYCTDIGWSPYFPMLAGIVTELGGLVSHGAVVAREYGLPSIVGVKGATRVFKTGDTVLLSGKTGTIELVV